MMRCSTGREEEEEKRRREKGRKLLFIPSTTRSGTGERDRRVQRDGMMIALLAWYSDVRSQHCDDRAALRISSTHPKITMQRNWLKRGRAIKALMNQTIHRLTQPRIGAFQFLTEHGAV